MSSIIILLFVLGYLSITLEHPLKLDKTVPALLMAALMWALLAVGFHEGWFSVIDSHENVFNFLKDGEHGQEGFHNLLLHTRGFRNIWIHIYLLIFIFSFFIFYLFSFYPFSI